MTARETTLGALTAADLGKRVRVEGRISTGVLVGIYRTDVDNSTTIWLRSGPALGGLSTTPVTVYDEEEA